MIKNKTKTILELSEAREVTLEHMFNSNENISVEWCFNTRAPEEGEICNDKNDEFNCKQNDNKLYNLLKKTIFKF